MGRASFCHQLIAGFFNDMHIKLCDQRRAATDTASSTNGIRQSTNQTLKDRTLPVPRNFSLSGQVSVGRNVLKRPNRDLLKPRDDQMRPARKVAAVAAAIDVREERSALLNFTTF